MKSRPKHVLFELPTADEIDALAITTPRLEVRKFEFDLGDETADLAYSPCKGQIVLVVSGKGGIILTRIEGSQRWSLPTGRISSLDDVIAVAKRIAREQCGIGIHSLELAAMYDVVWHYADITVKRLHLVYAGSTEDAIPRPGEPGGCPRVMLFSELPVELKDNAIVVSALADCSK